MSQRKEPVPADMQQKELLIRLLCSWATAIYAVALLGNACNASYSRTSATGGDPTMPTATCQHLSCCAPNHGSLIMAQLQECCSQLSAAGLLHKVHRRGSINGLGGAGAPNAALHSLPLPVPPVTPELAGMLWKTACRPTRAPATLCQPASAPSRGAEAAVGPQAPN